ncbi:hypothetical protein ACHAPJ_012785 [Fusarium lateritium]
MDETYSKDFCVMKPMGDSMAGHCYKKKKNSKSSRSLDNAASALLVEYADSLFTSGTLVGELIYHTQGRSKIHIVSCDKDWTTTTGQY